MDIPSSFRVLGYLISVEVVPADKWQDKDIVAVFNDHDNTIRIKRRSDELDIVCFWHEAIHAALHALNSKHYRDEVLVDTLAGAIVQIMETAQS